MSPTAPPVEGRDWLTTPPIPWSDFRGRTTVLAFWSLGCEASLLMLRRLTDLAFEWDDDVAVVAIHTPRFPFEDDSGKVRQAVQQHRIAFPVLHDPHYLTWNRYNPAGWPAIAVVDRRGRVIGSQAGTSNLDTVADVVASERALIAPSMPRPDLPRPEDIAADADSTLCFPGGLAVTPAGKVVVCDTGRNRVLVGVLDADLRTLRPDVEVTDLDRPTGVVARDEARIYLTESGTGSILELDLEAGRLDVLREDLQAPQGLLLDHDGSLVVADAGSDQLLRIADDGAISGIVAGTGFTGCRNGRADRAELAQPVALARTDSGIVFCDAASSNIRLLTDEGKVLSVTGNNFFDWGLVDGPAHEARLQRPSALCSLADGSVIIVDTGNDRLRLLRDRRITTLGLKGLSQPSAVVALPSGHLIVADTGNHRLVVVDPTLSTAWPLAVYPAAMTSLWEETSSPGSIG